MSTRRSKQKQIVRSDLTGRILNGIPCIACDEAIDYVKKQGFLVFEDKSIQVGSKTIAEWVFE